MNAFHQNLTIISLRNNGSTLLMCVLHNFPKRFGKYKYERCIDIIDWQLIYTIWYIVLYLLYMTSHVFCEKYQYLLSRRHKFASTL